MIRVDPHLKKVFKHEIKSLFSRYKASAKDHTQTKKLIEVLAFNLTYLAEYELGLSE